MLVLAVGARVAPAWLQALLSMRWLVFVGERAYSLYLWNYFIGQVVDKDMDALGGPSTLVTRIALTAAAALASYRFVERPAREELNRRIAARYATKARVGLER
ncbi:MAG: hypothetical protein ABIQ73_20115 [Acidimicrobiales bacterium]